MEWEKYLTDICKVVASKSKDRSTKVGCVITGPDHEIRTTGYNGFVRGADDTREDWYQRPLKYEVTVHAEANAVCAAARVGIPLKGCIAYVSLPPCAHCALLLTQAGVKEVKVLGYPEGWATLDTWKEQFKIAEEIFKEGKISFSFVDK